MKATLLFAVVCVLAPSIASAQAAEPPPPPGQQPQQQPAAGPTVYIGEASPPQPAQPAPQPQPQPQPQPVYGQQPGYGQQPVYGQPVYGQPVYAQPVYAQPVYAPYRPEPRTPGRSLMLAGGLTFGIMWGLTAVIGLLVAVNSSGSGATEGWMDIVPVAGPFINIGVLASRYSTYYSNNATGEVAYFLDGLVQAAGATMLIIGIAQYMGHHAPAPQRRVGSNSRAAQWALAPFATGTATGLSLSVAHF